MFPTNATDSVANEYVDKNIGTATPGTKLEAADRNIMQDEMIAMVEDTGQTVDPTGVKRNQLSRSLTVAGLVSGAGIDTGVVNVYEVDPVSASAPAPETLEQIDGALVTFTALFANTAACTLNYAGLGVRAIVTPAGAPLTAGDLSGNVIVAYNFPSNVWELLFISDIVIPVPPSIPVGALLTGGIDGLGQAPNGAAPTTTVDNAPGRCRDSTDTDWLELAAASSTVVPGLVANTTYSRFLTDAGDIQFDTDAEGATLLAGAVSKLRCVGMVRTDTGGLLLPYSFTKNIITFTLASKAAINSMTSPPAGCSTAVSIASWVPSEARLSQVLMGARGNAAGTTDICVGFDGTNTFSRLGGNSTKTADNDLNAWRATFDAGMMPVVGTTIYWGDGTEANADDAQLLMQAIELNL